MTKSPDSDAVACALQDVRMRFGDRDALRRLTFSIRAGSAVGLIGPNGAGKTTTLRLLTGQFAPTAGAVTVLGASFPTEAHNVSARIGALVGDAAVYGQLSAIGNMRVALHLLGVPRKEQRDAIDDALRTVNLNGSASRRTRSFSTGMRQRLALAMALVGTPTLLILDEPTSGMDPLERKALHDRLAAFRASGGTLIISSHHLLEIEKLVDRVILLDEGEIVADEYLDDIRRDERTRILVENRSHVEQVLAATGIAVRSDGDWLLCAAPTRDVLEALMAASIVPLRLETIGVSLESLFESRIGRGSSA